MRSICAVVTLTLSLAGEAVARERFSVGRQCSESNFSFGGRDAVVAMQSLEAGTLNDLEASVSRGPLAVVGGAEAFRIEVCKAAVNAADLAAIRVSIVNGAVVTRGPAHDDWIVGLEIHAPDGARLDLEAENGPVSIRDFDGRLVVNTLNGPLSIDSTSGEKEATVANGPVTISGGSGTARVRATNGPLTVNLSGSDWAGGSLDAATRNGPLTVRVPRAYPGGVVVESSGHGPVSCRAAGCENARVDWREADGELRTIMLGSGPEVVKLSTVNGPVTVRDE